MEDKELKKLAKDIFEKIIMRLIVDRSENFVEFYLNLL